MQLEMLYNSKTKPFESSLGVFISVVLVKKNSFSFVNLSGLGVPLLKKIFCLQD